MLMANLKKLASVACLPVLFILFFGVSAALAEVQAARTHPDLYSPGATVSVTVTVTYTDTLLALGIEDTVPEGWTYVSVTGSGSIQTKNDPGDSGTLEFYWITIPASPVTLTYTLQIPGGSSGDKAFSGSVIYYQSGNGQTLPLADTTIYDNEAPTDISLSNDTLMEGQPSGTTVGTLTTTDPDSGDIHVYSLVAGTGDTDNASFAIEGDTLKTAAVLHASDQTEYIIRVRSDDQRGGIFEKQLTIHLEAARRPSGSAMMLLLLD